MPLFLIAIRKFWPYLAGGAAIFLLIIALGLTRRTLAHSRVELKAEQTAHANDIASWKAASALATAHATQLAKDKESHDAEVTKVAQGELTHKLADARSAAAAYAQRLRTASADNQRSSSRSDLSAPGHSSGGAAGTSQAPVVDADDLTACSEAVVKAQGWQDWYKNVTPDPR